MGFLDASGITALVNKLKTKFQETLVSGTNIKTVNNTSLLGSGDITIEGGGGGVSTWYGTCSTADSTAAKIVTCTDFTLETGAFISVLFSTANTADTPTLNVNSTGDKTIYIGATTLSAGNPLKWSANTILSFIYDGTYFRYLGAKSASIVTPADGGGGWYGACATTASTAAKIGSCPNFIPTRGAIVTLSCATANTVQGALTLNINGTGARNIYVNGSNTSTTNPLFWNANDVLTFMYNSSVYHLIARGSLPVASTTQLGGVMVDGKSIVIENNVISTPNSVSVASETITIASNDWSNNACTKSVASLTDNSTVFVTYAPGSAADYLAANIYLSAQGSDTLTFSCTTTPSANVKVNVLIINKPYSLKGTTWYLNETLAQDTFDDYYINFTIGVYDYKAMRGAMVRNRFQLIYSKESSGTITAYNNGTWNDATYRTLAITDGADVRNTDLIAWLQANATQVS